MMTRFFSTSILFLMTMLSCGLVWHYLLNFQTEAPANPHTPDTFANGLSWTMMDETGSPKYQFYAPHLLHYADKDRTTFTSPHGIFYENNAPPWTIDARQGEALNGNAQIRLSGNVTMVQLKGSQNVMTTLKTEEALLYPKQRLITTDKFISAVQPSAEIEGVGMKLDLNLQTIDLLSHVKGWYINSEH